MNSSFRNVSTFADIRKEHPRLPRLAKPAKSGTNAYLLATHRHYLSLLHLLTLTFLRSTRPQLTIRQETISRVAHGMYT